MHSECEEKENIAFNWSDLSSIVRPTRVVMVRFYFYYYYYCIFFFIIIIIFILNVPSATGQRHSLWSLLAVLLSRKLRKTRTTTTTGYHRIDR